MSSNSSSTGIGVQPSSSAVNAPPSSSNANTSPTSAPTTEPTTSPSTTPTTIPPTTTPPTTSTHPTTTTPTTTTPTSRTPTTGPSSTPSVTTITQTPTEPGGATTTIVLTSTAPNTGSQTSSSSSSSASATSTTGLQSNNGKSTGGLTGGGKIAVAVVVPIVAVALLVLLGLFLWRKRRQRKDAEELRRKEVEEYGYNPNNDPTLPAVGSAGHDGPYEMTEDASGYRGWGTTAVASSGRKASTTLSGGQSQQGIGLAYSDGTSPTHGPVSDTISENAFVGGERPISGEQEPLGAMGPAAANNRSGDINRGPSNASSSYSAANRSDGSGEVPGSYGNPQYYNQYETGSPYGPNDTPYGSPPGRAEMSGQPVIRDVQARRNTRIENPSHFPQQSAGISQNF